MKEDLGTLAYYDTLFNGLVPCKVTGIRVYNEFGHYEVYFTVTATRGAWKKGDKFVSSPKNVIPRKMVFVRSGQYHIKTYFAWVNDESGIHAIVNR